MPLVYNELHSLAGSYLRNERPGHTLQCTALVHETYIRLVNMDGVRWQNRAQFFCISAQVVRHILVDHARRRAASKRGGDATVVPLDDALTIPARQDLDVEALDQSLDKLASIDERKSPDRATPVFRWFVGGGGGGGDRLLADHGEAGVEIREGLVVS